MIKKELAPEPPDGAMVVVIEWDGDRKVIWRDDGLSESPHPEEHWFDDEGGDPMGWEMYLKYATSVHHVAEVPFAASWKEN